MKRIETRRSLLRYCIETRRSLLRWQNIKTGRARRPVYGEKGDMET